MYITIEGDCDNNKLQIFYNSVFKEFEWKKKTFYLLAIIFNKVIIYNSNKIQFNKCLTM